MLLLLSPLLALPQEQATNNSCNWDIKEFYNADKISILPKKERNGIVQALLPDLRKSQPGMGYEPQDLTPQRLASLLRYTELTKTIAGRQIGAVTYQPQEPYACGNHGQCSGYLVEIGPHGVRSLVTDEGQGTSVGGTWGGVVLSRKGSPYPDILVLSTISPEVSVACYRWQGKSYESGCDVPVCTSSDSQK
jgi:hypothetical protein